jgi:hypothetical protein
MKEEAAMDPTDGHGNCGYADEASELAALRARSSEADAALAEIKQLSNLVPPDHRWRVSPPTAAEVHEHQWWWSKPVDGVPHILQLDVDLGSGKIFDLGEVLSGACPPPFDPADWPGEWAPCMTPDDAAVATERGVARLDLAQTTAYPRSDEDWRALVKLATALRRVLNEKPVHLKIGHADSPGGVLNAYREGDLSFDEAAAALTGRTADVSPAERP